MRRTRCFCGKAMTADSKILLVPNHEWIAVFLDAVSHVQNTLDLFEQCLGESFPHHPVPLD